MKLKQLLAQYRPINEQEQVDKLVMQDFLEKNPDAFLRENQVGHFCASAYIINQEHTKMLLGFHNSYQQWAYFGGHADGDEDMLFVAKKEVSEETGLKNIKVLSDGIFTLETSSINRHIKRGRFVLAHLHFDIDFLFEADENETTFVRPDENSEIKWFNLPEITPKLVGQSRYECCYLKAFEKIKKLT